MRIFLGLLVSPIIFIIAWSLPYFEHSAFGKWIVINTVLAYINFLVLAGISHLILKYFHWHSLLRYCGVMFCVALFTTLILGLLAIAGYESLYYSQTQVVENGSITPIGYLLQIQEAFISAVLALVCMAVFWFIAIFKTPGAKYA